MLLDDLCGAAERSLPAPVFAGVRRLANALLTPMAFAHSTGHFRSALLGKAVDRLGRPIPWYTYAAIDALRNVEFGGRDVLEFGAGQSTLWWASRARHVLAFEGSPDWHASLLKMGLANVRLRLCAGPVPEIDAETASRRFDVIIIDAFDRAACAERALSLLAEGGMIVLDNSERQPAAVAALRSAGLKRIDYCGPGPVVFRPFCTSFFFRDGCFLFSDSRAPAP